MLKLRAGWAFLSVFRVGAPGDLYLWRLRIFECPWFGIYLHAIHREDAGRDLHDHPWPFVSFVLRGSYVEEVGFEEGKVGVQSGRKMLRVRWLNWKHATDLHQIVAISRKPTWTLVLRGRRQRRWGFLGEHGWIDADDYIGASDPDQPALPGSPSFTAASTR